MDMKLTRRTVLAGAAALTAASTVTRVFAQEALAPVTIALSSNSLGLAPVRIAAQAKLFQKNGLDAKVTIADSGNAAMTALLSGSVEFAAPGLSEVLIINSKGQKVVVVANIHRGLGTSLVLSKRVAEKLGVKPDAPLEARLKALEGLKVALPSATSPSVAAFKGAASTAGASFDMVYMSQPAMIPALETGAVDAMVAAAPSWLRPVNTGSGYLWVSGPRGDIPAQFNTASSACLQATEAYAKANPKAIEAIRKTMQDVSKLILEQPDEAKRLLGEVYPDLSAADVAMVFDTSSRNWAKPVVTAQDIDHEKELLKASGLSTPAIEAVDSASLVDF